MKLRKALDRAQEERGRVSKSSLTEVEGPTSQVYSKSRQIKLDEKVVRENNCISFLEDSLEGDFYKAIRTQILQEMQKNGWKTLLITSALPGEGKTVTTINLAVTFAKELHQRVLLVDADLRRQSVYKYLGYESLVGLSDHLINDVALPDLITWPGVDNLSIISGGDDIRDSTEIISSKKMLYSVEEMKNRYKDRLIIFDSPPILTCPDTAAFLPYIDAVVMVVEAENTTTDYLHQARKLIPEEKFIGFVLNKIVKQASKDHYSSYY